MTESLQVIDQQLLALCIGCILLSHSSVLHHYSCQCGAFVGTIIS